LNYAYYSPKNSLNKKDPTDNCCYLEEHKLGTDPIGEKILLVAVPEESKLELLLFNGNVVLDVQNHMV